MPKGIDHFKLEVSDQAAGAMKDPKTADAVRDVMAKLRQALVDVDTTDQNAVEAALRAAGATQITLVDPDDFPEDDHGDG